MIRNSLDAAGTARGAAQRSKPLSEDNPTKRCSSCRQTFSLSQFHRDKRTKDGHRYNCKLCVKAYGAANSAHLSAQSAQWNKANPEKRRAYLATYNQKHGDAIRAYRRHYYLQHLLEAKERERKWRKDNPDKNASNSRNYKARKTNALGKHTAEEIEAMTRDQGGLCAYCEIPLFGSFQVDHMIPLSRGGHNDWSNLAIVCACCNKSKSAKTVEEFFGYERF